MAGKLRGQAAVLSAASVLRPELSYELNIARRTLVDTASRLRQESAPDLPALRGIEGAAAAAFFEAYRLLFAPALHFQGRNRRPPRDPVNAALSLAYTLEYAEGVRAAAAAGLDGFIGFYHDLRHGRQSLACDLCEWERGSVESWVWRLFRERVLRVEHFHAHAGSCLLGKAGRREFYLAIEPLLEETGRRQSRRCLALARALRPGAEANCGGNDEDLDS